MGWLDIIFPPTCVSCEASGAWLCDGCFRRLGFYSRAREAKSPFAAVLACGAYSDPVLRKIVTTFKYRSARCLEPVWRRSLKKFRDQFLDPWPWAGLSSLTVTSVPADPDRTRRRGMDHAALLADLVKQELVPWADRQTLLVRSRPTLQNANLPTDLSRAANVSGAFTVTRPITTPVLLLDDVLTTGATSQEAARILRDAGAPQVFLLVMAEG
jgi:predicted amidophosphoribosyltransferase